MPNELSPREREAIEHVAAGRTTKEIAAELSIAESTVNWHVSNAREKLGASTRAEAVALAITGARSDAQAPTADAHAPLADAHAPTEELPPPVSLRGQRGFVPLGGALAAAFLVGAAAVWVVTSGSPRATASPASPSPAATSTRPNVPAPPLPLPTLPAVPSIPRLR